jgi:hypothetical protein
MLCHILLYPCPQTAKYLHQHTGVGSGEWSKHAHLNPRYIPKVDEHAVIVRTGLGFLSFPSAVWCACSCAACSVQYMQECDTTWLCGTADRYAVREYAEETTLQGFEIWSKNAYQGILHYKSAAKYETLTEGCVRVRGLGGLIFDVHNKDAEATGDGLRSVLMRVDDVDEAVRFWTEVLSMEKVVTPRPSSAGSQPAQAHAVKNANRTTLKDEIAKLQQLMQSSRERQTAQGPDPAGADAVAAEEFERLMARIKEMQVQEQRDDSAEECSAVTADESSQIIIKFIQREGVRAPRDVPIILRSGNGSSSSRHHLDMLHRDQEDEDSSGSLDLQGLDFLSSHAASGGKSRVNTDAPQKREGNSIKRVFEGFGISAPTSWLHGIGEAVDSQGYDVVSPLIGVDFTGRGVVPMIAFQGYAHVVIRMYGEEAYRSLPTHVTTIHAFLYIYIYICI